MAYPGQPTYGAYDQQPPPQPGFGYPPNPAQPYYPPPPPPGYPVQPGYQPGYQPGMQPTVAQPTGGGFYPGQPPTQTIIYRTDADRAEDDAARFCLLWCAMFTCCCWFPLVPCIVPFTAL